MSDSNGPDNQLERCKYLWEEYKYRHDLAWRLIFQFTTAIVALAIVPYVQVALVKELGPLILIPPIIGFGLAWFGYYVMDNELELFGRIKKRYREWQNALEPQSPLHPVQAAEKDSIFEMYVKRYFLLLIILGFFNIIASLSLILYQWILLD